MRLLLFLKQLMLMLFCYVILGTVYFISEVVSDSWLTIMFFVYWTIAVLVDLQLPERSWKNPDLINRLHWFTRMKAFLISGTLVILYYWDVVRDVILPAYSKYYFG